MNKMFFKAKKYSDQISTTEDVLFDVILYLFDYDGCLSHKEVIESHCKNLILKNQSLFEQLKNKHKTNPQESHLFIGSGSARQSVGLDIFNAKRLKNGSCFVDLQQVAEEMGVSVVSLLLPDVFCDLPKGTSFLRGLNPHTHENHYSCIPDESKLTLLHAHIHSISEDYPDKQICIDFCDDMSNILSNLIRFYSYYPQMIPSNVTLYFSHYTGNNHTTWQWIKGVGEWDVHYRQTIIDMIAITEKIKGVARCCVKSVTPEKLNAYRRNFIEQMSEKNEIRHLKLQEKHTCLYTYKPNLLLNELAFWCLGEQKSIDSAGIVSWREERTELRSELFKKTFIQFIEENFFYGMQTLGYLDEQSLYAVDESGFTLLHRAVLYNNATAVDYLIDRFINRAVSLNNRTSDTNKSALDLAIDLSFDEIACMLFRKGALYASTQPGENHLIHVLARQNKQDEIKQLLTQDSRLINHADKEGKTILFYANQLLNTDLSRWLIEQGALEYDWHVVEYDAEGAYIS